MSDEVRVWQVTNAILGAQGWPRDQQARLDVLAFAQEGLKVSSIKSDTGEEAVLIEAMDDTGDYMEAQELGKALDAGRVQACIGGRV